MVCKLRPLYSIGCGFAIFLLPFLDSDSMSDNDAAISLCDTITDVNAESIRDFAIPFTFVLMLPLIMHLIRSLKKTCTTNIRSTVNDLLVVVYCRCHSRSWHPDRGVIFT
ncbi:DUF2645 family protein [Yersinia nurmii]|uniref:DUF2645 family protein n=1 Tax=Yersinia nurmii TaxID=685706 RepID=UPI00138E01B1